MYIITIRNNATGECRDIRHALEWSESSVFWLTEGNFGCDCNRWLDFERAGGNDPNLYDAQCGDGGFSILRATLEDGTVVELEA